MYCIIVLVEVLLIINGNIYSFPQETNTESTAQNVFSYAMIGDSVILQCQNTPGNTIIQWLRLNPSKNVTKCTYTDGWAVNEEIRNHHRITIIGSINSTTYNLQIENLTVSDSGEYRCVSQATNKRKSYDVHLCVREFIEPSSTSSENNDTTSTDAMGRELQTDFWEPEITTDVNENATNIYNVTTKSQINASNDFLNDGIYWLVGMVASGIVVFITVFLSYIYLKKLNSIVKNANQGHTISIEYREEQTNNIDNDNIEIYETHENVRENTHARSVTRIERRTINNEVYEIVQQHESSPNIQTDRLTQDEDNTTYQTVSSDWANDDHIYKELTGGQC